MSHFDHIPPGKKEVYDKNKQAWMLVDADTDSLEDLKILLDETRAELSESKKENKKLVDAVEKLNAKLIFAEKRLKELTTKPKK